MARAGSKHKSSFTPLQVRADAGSFAQPWIKPSLFDDTGDPRIIDEWTFGQYQDRDKALSTLKAHWDTWITQADFQAIAAAGYAGSPLPSSVSDAVLIASGKQAEPR